VIKLERNTSGDSVFSNQTGQTGQTKEDRSMRRKRTSSDQCSVDSAASKENHENKSERGNTPSISNSILATTEREKGSKRSIETQNRLNGILYGKGKEDNLPVKQGNRKESSRASNRLDMKTLLKQSSNSVFKGLQLDTIDPDFIFPGTVKHSDQSPALSFLSSGSFTEKMVRKISSVTGILPRKSNQDSLESESVRTASTVLTSTIADELVQWKEELLNNSKKKKEDSTIPSCPSTPSTVADTQTVEDDVAELTSFAETYQKNCPSYEVMPLEDRDVLSHLGGSFTTTGFSTLPPPEESLAYSAYSPSDTHTLDLLSPKGTGFLTRKLSTSRKSSSYTNSMYAAVSTTISRLGIFSAVTSAVPPPNQAPVVCAVPSCDEDMDVMEVKNEMYLDPEESLSNSQKDVKDMSLAVSLPNPLTLPLSLPLPAPALASDKRSSTILSALNGLDCDVTLLPMLEGLGKLKGTIVTIVLQCVVTRKMLVLDAATAILQLCSKKTNNSNRKEAIKGKNKNNEKNGDSVKSDNTEEINKKQKKSESQQVSAVLEKLTKQRLGANHAVARTVSSCCLLLVYLQLELQNEEYKENKTNKTVKKNKKEEKVSNEKLNNLIVSRFDRLAVATLSPFLEYNDVHWLSQTTTDAVMKDKDKDSKTEPALENVLPISKAVTASEEVKTLRSPSLRNKRSVHECNESSITPGREVKRKKSLTDEPSPSPAPVPQKSKRDCLWEIVISMKERYSSLTTVSPALRRLTRNYRPSVSSSGSASESDSSPLKSPSSSIGSPSMTVIMNSVRKQTRTDSISDQPQSTSEKSVQPVQQLKRSRSFLNRTQPLIPLSVAGTARLLTLTTSDCATTTAPSAGVVTNEVPQLRQDKPDVPIKTDGHTLKRTNSIVNVNKPTVGQRTGRGKGKSVRTSLKPDPNINSILSFTVPQRVSNGSGPVRKSPGRTSKQMKTASGSGDRGKDRHASKSTSSISSGSTNANRKEVEASDVLNSGGSVRRSARKRPREDVEDWGGHVARHTAVLRGDVNEVDETPAEKVRVRKSRMNLPTSGMRGLRGASAAMNELIGHPTRTTAKHGSTSKGTRGRSNSTTSNWDGREDSVGIADMQVSTVFSSGGSGRRSGAKWRSSSPFFLPSVDHLVNQNNQSLNTIAESQRHSAGTALGMEGNDEYVGVSSTGYRRSPRFTRDSISSNLNFDGKTSSSSSSASASATLNDMELALNLGLKSNAGSFSRNIYLQNGSSPAKNRTSINKDTRQSGIEVHNTPTIIQRKKRERSYSESGAPLTTPPAQNYHKPTRPSIGSPNPCDKSNNSKSFASSRSSPRRPYSPV
jgi:hypothetical protein